MKTSETLAQQLIIFWGTIKSALTCSNLPLSLLQIISFIFDQVAKINFGAHGQKGHIYSQRQ